jgi:hypothetical protein
MAIIREDRVNKEDINSINNIEEYINTNYLQIIENKIKDLELKRQQIEDRINLYNSINSSNNTSINNLLNDAKYLTITQNQQIAEPLINELNNILINLVSILSYKDMVTLNNLNYKEELYNVNKVDLIEGEFKQLQCPNPTNLKSIVNIDHLNKELQKLEQTPKPLQPLKYLITDDNGDLKWST